MSPCVTCELLARRDQGKAPLWDCILRTQYWDVVHSYDTAMPGWLVLVLRRHAAAVADLTVDEASECGELQRQVSIALREAVGCEWTYVAQFAESAEHRHVHYHVIPRLTGMPPTAIGPDVFRGYLGVSRKERVSERRMNAIAASVRVLLQAMRE